MRTIGGQARGRVYVQLLQGLPRVQHPRCTSPCPANPSRLSLPELTTLLAIARHPAQTYIAGESYAGQYIPYFASAILSAATSSLLPTQLKGLLIGNGWIDPVSQYPAYLDFALQAGVIKKGSQAEADVRKQVDACLSMLDKAGAEGVKIHNGQCENILGAITESTVQK